jgi:hypothetical protein
MSEATPPTAETGPDSAAGARWFVSCRYPHLSVTIRPAEDKTPTTRPVKGIYAQFAAMAKPNSLQGTGKRDRGHDDGSDLNDSGKWGIYGPVIDPGPEPDGGYQDDDVKVPKDRRLKAARKVENRQIIDRIRETGHYRKTVQDNQVSIHSILVELNWDPIPHSGNLSGVVTRGRPSIGKDGVNDSESTAAAESRPTVPSVKVPSLGRQTAAKS